MTKIIHSLAELPHKKEMLRIGRPTSMLADSIFLAGPVSEDAGWQYEARDMLIGKGFDGTIFCPNIYSPEDFQKTKAVLNWNKKAMRMSTAIMFWLPAEENSMYFDTYFQLGRYANSDQTVVGMPENPFNRREIAHYYAYEHAWKDTHKTLEETVKAAMERAFKRTDTFREIATLAV